MALKNPLDDATSKSTYASVIQNVIFPTKDQAIVMDAFDDISIKEYTYAIGKITNPSNIRFASRIANNRVCIYLSDKSLVDKLTSEHVNITIKDRSLSIRPLLTKAKRIILSNVCPVITHTELENYLKKLGIRMLSPITFIKAGFNEAGFTHILSFRRQVYIHPDDTNKLPENLQICHEDTNYWIFVSLDNPTCFVCKKEGHLAKHCPSANNNETISESTNLSQSKDFSLTKELSPNSLTLNEPENRKESQSPVPNYVNLTEKAKKNGASYKRPLTSSTSNNSQRDSSVIAELPVSSYKDTNNNKKSTKDSFVFANPSSMEKKTTPVTKKMKKESTKASSNLELMDHLLAPVKEILNQNPESYILSYEQVRELLIKAIGNPNLIELAQSFTTDTTSLIKMLRDIYLSVTDRSIRNRLTRIIKKLELHNSWADDNDQSEESGNTNGPDSDTDFSQSSMDFCSSDRNTPQQPTKSHESASRETHT